MTKSKDIHKPWSLSLPNRKVYKYKSPLQVIYRYSLLTEWYSRSINLYFFLGGELNHLQISNSNIGVSKTDKIFAKM